MKNKLLLILLFVLLIISIDSFPDHWRNRDLGSGRGSPYWGRYGRDNYDDRRPEGTQRLSYFSSPSEGSGMDEIIKPTSNKGSYNPDKQRAGKARRAMPISSVGKPQREHRKSSRKEAQDMDSSDKGADIGTQNNGAFWEGLNKRHRERMQRFRERLRSFDLGFRTGLGVKLRGESEKKPSKDKGIQSLSSLKGDYNNGYYGNRGRYGRRGRPLHKSKRQQWTEDDYEY